MMIDAEPLKSVRLTSITKSGLSGSVSQSPIALKLTSCGIQIVLNDSSIHPVAGPLSLYGTIVT